MSKYKRTILIALAVVFVAAIFLSKTDLSLKKKETYQGADQKNGVTYSNVPLENLVNKDTDADGILDWEEGLWGTDPTKQETTPGVLDSIAIKKLKDEQAVNAGAAANAKQTEKLTQTDQFSRELFGTIASLSQNGQIDAATIDALSTSLAEKIANSSAKKVFLISDLKVTNDDSAQAYINYSLALENMYKKYKTKYTVLDVLQKFIVDEENVDVRVLKDLDHIITNTKKMVDVMAKMNIPKSISALHLEVLNTMEKLVENISDIKLYESDSILAIRGISQYSGNAAKLESDFTALANIVAKKIE